MSRCDVAYWHERDMPTDTANVCLSGWTGSHRQEGKTALLTQNGHSTAWTCAVKSLTLRVESIGGITGNAAA
jgi:hypothetical protein